MREWDKVSSSSLGLLIGVWVRNHSQSHVHSFSALIPFISILNNEAGFDRKKGWVTVSVCAYYICLLMIDMMITLESQNQVTVNLIINKSKTLKNQQVCKKLLFWSRAHKLTCLSHWQHGHSQHFRCTKSTSSQCTSPPQMKYQK